MSQSLKQNLDKIQIHVSQSNHISLLKANNQIVLNKLL